LLERAHGSPGSLRFLQETGHRREVNTPDLQSINANLAEKSTKKLTLESIAQNASRPYEELRRELEEKMRTLGISEEGALVILAASYQQRIRIVQERCSEVVGRILAIDGPTRPRDSSTNWLVREDIDLVIRSSIAGRDFHSAAMSVFNVDIDKAKDLWWGFVYRFSAHHRYLKDGVWILDILPDTQFEKLGEWEANSGIPNLFELLRSNIRTLRDVEIETKDGNIIFSGYVGKHIIGKDGTYYGFIISDGTTELPYDVWVRGSLATKLVYPSDELSLPLGTKVIVLAYLKNRPDGTKSLNAKAVYPYPS